MATATRPSSRLERYLYYKPDETGALIRFGMLLAPDVDQAPPGKILQAQRVLERALVVLGGSKNAPPDVTRRCIDLELRLAEDPRNTQLFLQEAQANLLALLTPGDDPKQKPNLDGPEDKLEEQLTATTGQGRLKWQLGLCLEGMKKYGPAKVCYKAARADDPTLVDAYVRQAHVLRDELKEAAPDNIDKADGIMSARLAKGENDQIIPTGDEDGLIANVGTPESVRDLLDKDTGGTSEVARIAAEIARVAAEDALAAAKLAAAPGRSRSEQARGRQEGRSGRIPESREAPPDDDARGSRGHRWQGRRRGRQDREGGWSKHRGGQSQGTRRGRRGMLRTSPAKPGTKPPGRSPPGPICSMPVTCWRTRSEPKQRPRKMPGRLTPTLSEKSPSKTPGRHGELEPEDADILLLSAQARP